jgi:hypothetical protein
MKTVHDVVLRPQRSAYTAKAVLVDDLRLPIHVALGRYEAASDQELHELIADLTHERDRRVS